MSHNSPKQSSMALKSTEKSPNQKLKKKAKKKKRKKRTCGHNSCRKKLLLSDLPCRCAIRFCSHHRLPETHSCSHNFNNETDLAFMKRVGLGGGKICKMEII